MFQKASVDYYVTHRSNILKTVVTPRFGRVFVVTDDYTPTRWEKLFGRTWRKSR